MKAFVLCVLKGGGLQLTTEIVAVVVATSREEALQFLGSSDNDGGLRITFPTRGVDVMLECQDPIRSVDSIILTEMPLVTA